MAALIAPGSLIDDKYEIVRMIGRGGFGAVYEAMHVQLNRRVAIKLLNRGDSTEQVSQRFLREAKALSVIHHRNLPIFYGYGVWQEVPYIAMEWLEGRHLAGILQESQHLSLQQTIPIMIQLCDVLACTHANGVIHRDLTTNNVLLLDNGVVKLIDFGLAKTLIIGEKGGQQQLTEAGFTVGTAQYMSPEQCQGRPVAPTSDIYSLGVIFYECLVGRPPFSGDAALAVMMMQMLQPLPRLTVDEKAPDSKVVLRTQEILDKCTAKEPRHRFESCSEFRNELMALALLVSQSQQSENEAKQQPFYIGASNPGDGVLNGQNFAPFAIAAETAPATAKVGPTLAVRKLALWAGLLLLGASLLLFAFVMFDPSFLPAKINITSGWLPQRMGVFKYVRWVLADLERSDLPDPDKLRILAGLENAVRPSDLGTKRLLAMTTMKFLESSGQRDEVVLVAARFRQGALSEVKASPTRPVRQRVCNELINFHEECLPFLPEHNAAQQDNSAAIAFLEIQLGSLDKAQLWMNHISLPAITPVSVIVRDAYAALCLHLLTAPNAQPADYLRACEYFSDTCRAFRVGPAENKPLSELGTVAEQLSINKYLRRNARDKLQEAGLELDSVIEHQSRFALRRPNRAARIDALTQLRIDLILMSDFSANREKSISKLIELHNYIDQNQLWNTELFESLVGREAYVVRDLDQPAIDSIYGPLLQNSNANARLLAIMQSLLFAEYSMNSVLIDKFGPQLEALMHSGTKFSEAAKWSAYNDLIHYYWYRPENMQRSIECARQLYACAQNDQYKIASFELEGAALQYNKRPAEALSRYRLAIKMRRAHPGTINSDWLKQKMADVLKATGGDVSEADHINDATAQ